MCSRVLGGLFALALSAGTAAAQDFENTGWTRTELPTGDMVWIATGDDGTSLRVLRIPGSRPGRYIVDEYRFSCDGGVETSTMTYGNDGPGPDPEPRPEREVRRGGVEGALYDIACEGAPALTDIEVGSAREALDYHAMAEERGWNGERRRSWDSGPGGEEREEREPREPPAPYDN